MLGMTFDEPLHINVSMSEQKIIQTLDETEWVPSMIGALQIECS
jgi:hypothetical protein